MMRTQDGWDRALRACVTRWAGSAPRGMMRSQGNRRMMGNGGPAGMMRPGTLMGLKGASGPAFDRRYLTMMIRHHRSVIALATSESTGGSDPAAKRLARQIRMTQTRELAQLRQLLRP